MEFFDRKEEVLDIQLTRHGKRKLMRGEFDPEFYSFHDEGILYDPNYADYDEHSVDAQDRITDRTAYMKPQSIFSEAGKKELRGKVGRAEELHKSEKLGTADLAGQEAPAMHVEMLQRSIDSVTGSSGSLSVNAQDIPQVNLGTVKYEAILKPSDAQRNVSPDADILRRTTPNDQSIEVRGDTILIALDEENTPFKNNNFDIEVFEIEEQPGSDEQKLNDLNFFRSNEDREFPDIYRPETPQQQIVDLTTSSVEYFLDINLDDEIDRVKLCRQLGEQTKDIFEKELECQNVDDNRAVRVDTPDRYGSDVDPNDSGDKCP